MIVSSKATLLLGGLTLLTLFGCQAYSPYGYGSGYGYSPPGTYRMPPAGYAPGTTVVPGTVQPRDGNLGQPGSLKPNSSGLNAPIPGTGSAASINKTPVFEANRGTGTGFLPNENPVPKPKIPESSGFPDTSGGTGKTIPVGGTENPAKGASDVFPSGTSPFGSGTAISPSTDSARIKLTGSGNEDSKQPASREPATQEPARFQPPKSATPIPTPQGGSSTIIKPPAGTPMSNAAGTPNPYDYDKTGYTWLRGKVDFDQKTKSWQIIYSLSGKDKFGGSLILGDNPKLKDLQNDDVVLVEGRLDTVRKDDRGMPIYKIDHMFGPLVPKTKVSNNGTPPKGLVSRR